MLLWLCLSVGIAAQGPELRAEVKDGLIRELRLVDGKKLLWKRAPPGRAVPPLLAVRIMGDTVVAAVSGHLWSFARGDGHTLLDATVPEVGFGDLYLPHGGVVTVDGKCPTKVAERFLVDCGPVIVWVPGPCLTVVRDNKVLGTHMF